MGLIKINAVGGGILGYIVRRCTLADMECISYERPPCTLLDSKTGCYLHYFSGPSALQNAVAYVKEINPKGALATGKATIKPQRSPGPEAVPGGGGRREKPRAGGEGRKST